MPQKFTSPPFFSLSLSKHSSRCGLVSMVTVLYSTTWGPVGFFFFSFRCGWVTAQTGYVQPCTWTPRLRSAPVCVSVQKNRECMCVCCVCLCADWLFTTTSLITWQVCCSSHQFAKKKCCLRCQRSFSRHGSLIFYFSLKVTHSCNSQSSTHCVLWDVFNATFCPVNVSTFSQRVISEGRTRKTWPHPQTAQNL